MFFGIDHIVLCGTQDDHRELSERLVPAGFVPVPGRLRFDESGVHSESLAYRGGGFVEVVYPVAANAPAAWFASDVPRVIGIGVSTDAFEGDTAGWLWTMDEELLLDDGTRHRIHAAGPHEHLSELYLFAMDRPDRALDHPGLAGQARLTGLTFAGGEHELWRERLRGWLGETDRLGEVELRFEPGPHPRAQVSLAFEVPTASGVIQLAAGAIELARTD
jgi:hypothetical protein